MFEEGEPMPDPITLPRYPNEWKNFGDGGELMMIDERIDGCSMYFFKTERDTYFKAHNHESVEVMTVIRGEVVIGIKNGHWEMKKLKPGDSIRIPARVMHDCEFIGKTLVSLTYIPGFLDNVWEGSFESSN